MKARGRLVFLVCAMAAVLALPATAAAKPGYYASKPLRMSMISVSGSNGYSIKVFAFGSKQVMLFASRGFESSTSVTYSVRGRVSDERIEARFGSLGRVSLRWEPNGVEEVQKNPAGCKGRPSVTRRGRFTGTIRFRGEQGFTRVRASAAPGFVSRGYRVVCKRPDRGEDRPSFKFPKATSLSAISSRGGAPWFSVYKQEDSRSGDFPSGEEAGYTARATEKRQGMTISRSASASSPAETFAFTPPGSSPVSATVAPSWPFSGTAAYEKSPGGGASWSGDLAVELPGRGVLPLADSTYRAKLCRSFSCACPVGHCAFVIVTSGRPQVQRLRQLAADAGFGIGNGLAR